MRPAGLGAAFVAGLLAAGCGGRAPDPAAPEGIRASLAQVAGDLNLNAYLQNAPAAVTSAGGIEEHTFDPAGPATCLHGTPFKVSVRRGSTDEVLFYLQGGGACWDEETCVAAPMTREYAESLTQSNETEGVFADRAENPFRGWNVVFAGYCDGSLWMGDADAAYGKHTVRHRGLANAAAAASVLRAEFPEAKRIVIAGSSAGGFGTLAGYVAVRTAFPGARLAVVNDSGPWRFNPHKEDMTAQVQSRWQPWRSPAFDPPACERCRVEVYRIADWAMRQDPATRWALFSFDKDAVIADIYMGFGPTFPGILRETVDYLASRHPGQFAAYVTPGYDHTRLASDAFYEPLDGGPTLAAWLSGMLDDQVAWESNP